MKIYDFKDMKGGWFCGDFEPSVIKTAGFEVCYKVHQKDEYWAPHTHKVATEVTFLVKGKMLMRGQVIEAGQIFVIEPDEIADPQFLETCEVVVVKVPSVKGDKYEV